MMNRTIKINFIILFLSLIFNPLNAQDYCIPHRFVDNYYFRSRDIHVDRNIVYGQAINFKGNTEILDMDVYYPKMSVDTLKKRPLIMLVHGGHKGDNSKTEKYCPLFTQRGFVVANINRRTGLKNNSEAENAKSHYRALQDAHAALRYLVNNADTYRIDTTALFIGGVSTGAVTIMGLAFLNQSDFDKQFPQITSNLGRIDNSGNKLNTSFTIRGAINMWGQIPDTSDISQTEAMKIPVIIFHSTADSSQCPYKKAIELTKRYQTLKGCYQLHTSTGTGHTQGISKYYIAEHTGCFLKSILFHSCNSFEIEVDNENLNCNKTLMIDNSEYQRWYIKLDPSIIIQYAGVYKTKGQRIELVSEDGQLFFINERSGFKSELYPESENDFFLKDDNVQIAFNRNKKGQVYGLTLYIDAREINLKKTK